MKAIGLLLVMLVLQSCYHSYYKSSDWWYLEDWDANHDLVIDKSEFVAGFEKYKVTKKVGQKNAAEVFVTADENKDDKLSGVEFYVWEENL